MANILPAIFFGHGNPMNAVTHNNYTDAWRLIGEQTPKPKAILSISAHWYVPETGVTVTTAPRTIHDFIGRETRQLMGSGSRHLVRAAACLSRGRYSRRPAQHRRDQARVFSF
jgi:hypothetical protein